MSALVRPSRRTSLTHAPRRKVEPLLSFAVQLAAVDTSGFDEARWKQLTAEVKSYLDSVRPRIIVTDDEDLSIERFAKLQTAVRSFLRLVADLESWGNIVGLGRVYEIRLARPVFELARHRGGATLSVPASMADGFLLAIAFALEREKTPRVKLCPMTECDHRMFYRLGRQKFCSEKCNDRQAQRESRARKRARASKRRKDKAPRSQVATKRSKPRAGGAIKPSSRDTRFLL
jgi:hypothetical protein